jgi:hypothetical protein
MSNEPDAAIGASKTLAEFCITHRISLTTYHQLKRQGRGPREMNLGRAIRISASAERDWIAARERPGDSERQLIALEAEARRKSALAAAQASARSPKHVSKRASAGGRS